MKNILSNQEKSFKGGCSSTKSCAEGNKILEYRLTELVKEEQQKQLTVLKSIPGMGSKTAIMLIVLTNGFANSENARQLCNYTGMTSTLRESAISLRGRSRINQMGNAKLRNLLFMCSFSACKHKACRYL